MQYVTPGFLGEEDGFLLREITQIDTWWKRNLADNSQMLNFLEPEVPDSLFHTSLSEKPEGANNDLPVRSSLLIRSLLVRDLLIRALLIRALIKRDLLIRALFVRALFKRDLLIRALLIRDLIIRALFERAHVGSRPRDPFQCGHDVAGE